MVLTLRPLTLDDTDAVHAWCRLPEACRYQAWGPNTYEETLDYVQTVIAAADRLVFAVLADGDMVGTAELGLHGDTTAEIGYAVHPDRWGRGIASAAARELVRKAFAEFGRHRVFGTCDPRNEASAAVMRKIGMRYEGRMRGTLLIRDGWRDSDLYAIIDGDPV